MTHRAPLCTVAALFALLALAGCSSEPTSTTPDASGTDGAGGSDASVTDAPVTDAPVADASSDGCTGAAPQTPSFGMMTCNTYDFGLPAQQVQTVQNAITFGGGTIPPGIYDATAISRTTGMINYTFRATLVLRANGTFSEVRELQTGSSPTTRKSGTWSTSVDGGLPSLDRAIDCGGADGGMETNKLPYAVDVQCDGTVLLHMGTANLWFTYKRRP